MQPPYPPQGPNPQQPQPPQGFPGAPMGPPYPMPGGPPGAMVTAQAASRSIWAAVLSLVLLLGALFAVGYALGDALPRAQRGGSSYSYSSYGSRYGSSSSEDAYWASRAAWGDAARALIAAGIAAILGLVFAIVGRRSGFGKAMLTLHILVLGTVAVQWAGHFDRFVRGL